ncbi:MAG: hypothetical protein IT304_10700 [Dehalococcoidia bacterium]|nr:hypothetical protein [Dehalococcoidia bacterium]
MTAASALTQAARLLGLAVHPAAEAAIRDAISRDPERFADALFAEAADSDDVTGIESGAVYLEDRLVFFGDLIAPPARQAIHERFRQRSAAWA